jgi:predicted O-methyltransferase YrrM
MKRTLEHAAKPTDIHQHLVTLHNLVTSIAAKTVIELGVNLGESTVALLEAVHATEGTLISVDIQLLPNVVPMLTGYGLISRWQFNLSDDIAFGEAWQKDSKGQADIIFIDTSHTFDHTTKEIAVYEPILRPGGIMVFHDTVSFYDGVQKPITKFLKTHKNWPYENKTNCNGLGILRKPA